MKKEEFFKRRAQILDHIEVLYSSSDPEGIKQIEQMDDLTFSIIMKLCVYTGYKPIRKTLKKVRKAFSGPRATQSVYYNNLI